MDYRAHLPQTAINEVLVMGLATAVGLDVAPVRYAPELDAAVIARYDRQWVDGDLQRLHQNDLCQSLGIEPGRKYESDGGPTLAMCCTAVMQHSSQPALDKKRMLEWAVFNVAVGNMDSHAKNLSLLSTGGHTRLAPFYDLICTTVYEHLSKRFAFKIGGENRPGWMMDRHWDRLAGELAVRPQLLRTIRLDICLRIERELPKVTRALRAQVAHPEGLAMIDLVETEIRRCTGQVVARTV
ncbi:HipA domain protein [Alicycliphilus sp. B1]|nr:HipA domain protein [Alicycliphilus sp. B1]